MGYRAPSRTHSRRWSGAVAHAGRAVRRRGLGGRRACRSWHGERAAWRRGQIRPATIPDRTTQPQPVTVGNEDQRCVPMPITAFPGGADKLFDFGWSQILPRAQIAIAGADARSLAKSPLICPTDRTTYIFWSLLPAKNPLRGWLFS